MAVMIPRPAQPTPGSGPPDSTHLIPRKPVITTSSSSKSSTEPLSAAKCSTVVWALQWRINRVESALGSHPTIKMR